MVHADWALTLPETLNKALDVSGLGETPRGMYYYYSYSMNEETQVWRSEFTHSLCICLI